MGLRHILRVVHVNIHCAGFVLWTFIRCFREMILLSYSWRIFLFHSTNSSVVILGFAKTIRSMRESKPISISLLHLFQCIDIASRKLGLLLTSFLNLEFVIVLRSPVRTWPWFSSAKSLCCWQSHCTMPVPFFISSFVPMEDTVSLQFIILFFIALPRLFATEGGLSIFNLSANRFFTLSKWSIKFRFI